MAQMALISIFGHEKHFLQKHFMKHTVRLIDQGVDRLETYTGYGPQIHFPEHGTAQGLDAALLAGNYHQLKGLIFGESPGKSKYISYDDS